MASLGTRLFYKLPMVITLVLERPLALDPIVVSSSRVTTWTVILERPLALAPIVVSLLHGDNLDGHSGACL